MKIASLNDRFIGALIDYLLWIVVTIIGYSLSSIINNGWIIYSIIFLPFLLKDITGQSPGKKIVKTKIVSKKNRNKKPNIFFLMIRNLFYFILTFDVLFIFFTRENRRLVDIVTGTVVVKDN
ncbi:MAG: RDD family protein [bacterium]